MEEGLGGDGVNGGGKMEGRRQDEEETIAMTLKICRYRRRVLFRIWFKELVCVWLQNIAKVLKVTDVLK